MNIYVVMMINCETFAGFVECAFEDYQEAWDFADHMERTKSLANSNSRYVVRTVHLSPKEKSWSSS